MPQPTLTRARFRDRSPYRQTSGKNHDNISTSAITNNNASQTQYRDSVRPSGVYEFLERKCVTLLLRRYLFVELLSSLLFSCRQNVERRPRTVMTACWIML